MNSSYGTLVCRPVQTGLEQLTALQIRWLVFVDEMHVSPHNEFDADDVQASHLLTFVGDQPAGTARLVVRPSKCEGVPQWGQIGRVAVLPVFRSLGVGTALLEFFHSQAQQMNLPETRVDAMLSAVSFYERLDYRAVGPTFFSEGYASVRMHRQTLCRASDRV